MSASPHSLLTPQQYIEQERRAELKCEFYRGITFPENAGR